MNDSTQTLQNSSTEAHKVLGTSITTASGLTVGYMLWVLRSGTLLASILTSLPAWRFIDPLPVLDSLANDDDVDVDENDQESLESMVEEQLSPSNPDDPHNPDDHPDHPDNYSKAA